MFLSKVELFEFRGEDITEDEDGGIIRRIITKGEGYSKPNEGAIVEGSNDSQLDYNSEGYGKIMK